MDANQMFKDDYRQRADVNKARAAEYRDLYSAYNDSDDIDHKNVAKMYHNLWIDYTYLSSHYGIMATSVKPEEQALNVSIVLKRLAENHRNLALVMEKVRKSYTVPDDYLTYLENFHRDRSNGYERDAEYFTKNSRS
jgi:hypothetical protein